MARIDQALATARVEAGNLAALGTPSRLDVQEFIVAAQTLVASIRPVAGLPPNAPGVLGATAALLPEFAAAIDNAAQAPASPEMSPDEARTILGAAPPPLPARTAFPKSAVPVASMPAAVSPEASVVADAGLTTLRSRHSVAETLDRFEAAVRARGWVVVTRIDHAALAQAAGLQLRPRTVVVFGNPGIGTAMMRNTPTLAIDLPLRALVWEDDGGGVWLTGNSADYLGRRVYPRHGIAPGPDALAGTARFLDAVSRAATE